MSSYVLVFHSILQSVASQHVLNCFHAHGKSILLNFHFVRLFFAGKSSEALRGGDSKSSPAFGVRQEMWKEQLKPDLISFNSSILAASQLQWPVALHYFCSSVKWDMGNARSLVSRAMTLDASFDGRILAPDAPRIGTDHQFQPRQLDVSGCLTLACQTFKSFCRALLY